MPAGPPPVTTQRARSVSVSPIRNRSRGAPPVASNHSHYATAITNVVILSGDRQLCQSTRLRRDQPGDEDQNAQQQRNPAPPFSEKARGGRGRECHLAVVLHDGDDVVVEMSHVPSALRFDVHLHRLAVTKAFHLPFSGHKRRALVIRALKRILKRKK